MPPQKVQKNQLKSAKLGTALMETTEQNIFDKLVDKLRSKPHICPKVLELVDNGTLEHTKEVKRDDCFPTFGPQRSLFFIFLQKHS